MGRAARSVVGLVGAAALLAAGQPVVHADGGDTGSRIAWTSTGDIVTARPDGSDRTRLTRNPRYETAVWAPGGRRLAIVQWQAAADQRNRLMLVSADGEHRRLLARSRHAIQRVAWAPGGRRLAYCLMDTSNPDLSAPYPSTIVVVDVRTGSRTRLAPMADRLCHPAWSPSGDRIAYLDGTPSDSGTGDYDVMVRDLAGGTVTAVVTDPAVSHTAVAWHPHEDRLVLSRALPAPGPDAAQPVRLETVDVDGSDLAPLTDPGETQHQLPRWSPDGSHVLFFRMEQSGLFRTHAAVVGADGGPVTLLRRAELGDADWAPSGRRVVLARLGDLVVVRLDGSHVRRVTRTVEPDIAPDWGP